MSFVIDASIVLAYMLPDENDPIAASAMNAMAKTKPLAPLHWPIEIANGLLMAQRRRRITPAIRANALADVALLPVTLDDLTIEMVWSRTSDIALRCNLSIYDAAYLELAMRKRLPLATLDDNLMKAADAEGVAIFAD